MRKRLSLTAILFLSIQAFVFMNPALAAIEKHQEKSGDQVEIEENGKIKIKDSDGSLVNINPNGLITIHDSDGTNFSMKLPQGILKYLTLGAKSEAEKDSSGNFQKK